MQTHTYIHSLSHMLIIQLLCCPVLVSTVMFHVLAAGVVIYCVFLGFFSICLLQVLLMILRLVPPQIVGYFPFNPSRDAAASCPIPSCFSHHLLISILCISVSFPVLFLCSPSSLVTPSGSALICKKYFNKNK